MKFSEKTHTGLIRQGNEDSYCISPDLNLAVIADGMGGHEAGEVASLLAVQTVENYIRLHPEYRKEPVRILKEAVIEANQKVYQASQEKIGCRGMGTTVSAGLIIGKDLYLAHIGDSRIYLINRSIHILTRDHSLVNELVINGGISEEEAQTHPQKNVLTRALGTSAEVEVDLIHTTVRKGDRLLFCTDGLSNLILKDELKKVVREGATLDESTERLLEMALARGGHDNITIILVEVD